MALTFSYKLVNSDTTGTSNTSSAFEATGGNTTGEAGTAYTPNEVEVYSHGSALDQARQYWLEVYAQETNPENGKLHRLESLDLSLELTGDLFKVVDGSTNFYYADALDLFRSKSTDEFDNGIRFTSGSADSFSSGTTGIIIGKDGEEVGPQFVGRIQLDVADDTFTGAAGNLSSYITVTANAEETIITTRNKNDNGRAQVHDLGDYSGGVIAVTSETTVAYKSGEISSDVATAFDDFGTVLLDPFTGNAYLDSNDQPITGAAARTNLVREGQTMTGSFTIDNIGEAALTNLNFTGAIVEANTDLRFTAATLLNNVGGGGTEDSLGIDQETGVLTTATLLEIGVRNSSTGDFEGTADALRVDFESTIAEGAAGSVAKLDFSNYKATAAGELDHTVFDGAVIENLVTYMADINYDGKVGMMDLAVLNAANERGVASTDTDVDHDGFINIEDLQALGAQWGQSLWTDGDNNYQNATPAAPFDMSAQNTGLDSAQVWGNNNAFTAAGAAAAASTNLINDAALFEGATVDIDSNYGN